MYSVVVTCNSNVFGVWTFPNKLSVSDKLELRKLIRETVKEIYPGGTRNYHVQFSEHIVANNLTELRAGIKESLENEVGF